MKEPGVIEITTHAGKTFTANRYRIENGIYDEIMIYWYQGRGRTEANEYKDKVHTIWDSVWRSRSDGAMIRVMTSVGDDEASATQTAIDLSALLADKLPEFIPE
jgi:EpsI family protein